MLTYVLISALAGGIPAGAPLPAEARFPAQAALLAGPLLPAGTPLPEGTPRPAGAPLTGGIQAPEATEQGAPTTPGTTQAWDAGTLEVGARGGYAVGKVYDAPRTPSRFAQLLVRLGVHFGATGSGWMRGNISIVAEGVGSAIDQQPRAQGGGLNLLFGYTWAAGRWRPRFLGGAGILFTNREVPPGETTFNFTPQAGVGIDYLLNGRWALGGEYRFHHLSNKGKTETNPGINSHLFLFGVSWFH
jgi:hypothetical protein